MADNDRKTTPSALPLIGALAVIIGAFMVSRKPLESSRPRPPSGLESTVQEVDKVDAMLWQDPFQVALDHEKTCCPNTPAATQTRIGSCSSSHSLSQIGRAIDDAIEKGGGESKANGAPAVHLLLVMVRDGRTAEDHERRLRNRYTLLTALQASGMVPEDTAHIQYCRPAKPAPGAAAPLVLPFECFRQDQLDPTAPNTIARPRRVLVVWLPEGAFGDKPLAGVKRLLEDTSRCVSKCDLFAQMWLKTGLVRVDLIGPSRSTTLRSMVKEIEETSVVPENPPATRGPYWLRIYSPWSTASPALLIPDWAAWAKDGAESTPSPKEDSAAPGASADTPTTSQPWVPICKMYGVLSRVFEDASINFIRMIGTDDLLAMHIIQELQRRGVRIFPRGNRGPDDVVLISEWDTFYGKAFPLTFETMMESMREKPVRAGGDREPNWTQYPERLNRRGVDGKDVNTPASGLRVYTYIAGVDGRLPEPVAQETGDKDDKTPTASRWAYQANLELPIGQGQLDYVRRLAQSLRDEYGPGSRRRLKAIGVVGSDVYDKLILLHALREQFRNAILFTTDLDARLLHQEQFRWTRNILVVSNFGLELDSAYQSDRGHASLARFPPFRDNYQTAFFLACRAALGLHLDNRPDKGVPLYDMKTGVRDRMLIDPRIFEIGRGRAVDLSICQESWGHLHPPRELCRRPIAGFLAAKWRTLILPAASVGLLPLLGVELVLAWGRFITRRQSGVRKTVSGLRDMLSRTRIHLLVAAGALAFLGLVLSDHYGNPGGEPFSLTSGTSVWPGLSIWLLGVFLGGYFVVLARDIIQTSNAHVSGEFPLLHSPPPGVRTSRWPRTADLKQSLFWPLYLSVPTSTTQPDGREVIRVQSLWDWYVRTGSTAYRLVRTTLLCLPLLVVVAFLFVAFGRPFAPYRGEVSRIAYRVLGGTLISLQVFLLFFAVDAILLSLRLIRPLLHCDPPWRPQNTTVCWNVEGEDDQSEWRTVRFIAHVTKATGRLLYLPSITLLLLMAGRFWYFDYWSFPLSIVLLYLLLGLCIIACSVASVVTARHARTLALESLKEKLRDAQSGPGKDVERASQITLMKEEIESLRQGAFRPLAENPVVHFLLIPSGGVGLLSLLAYVLPA